MTAQRWSLFAGLLTISGGVAWLAKFAVIVATNGRVFDSGAAAWFLRLGVICLVVGVSGFAIWLTRGRHRMLRLVAVVLSPITFFASFLLIDSVAKVVVGTRGPAYLPGEAGIAAVAVLWLGLGVWLLFAVCRAKPSIDARSTAA